MRRTPANVRKIQSSGTKGAVSYTSGGTRRTPANVRQIQSSRTNGTVSYTSACVATQWHDAKNTCKRQTDLGFKEEWDCFLYICLYRHPVTREEHLQTSGKLRVRGITREAVPMVTMVQSADNWRNTRSHTLTHLHQHSCA